MTLDGVMQTPGRGDEDGRGQDGPPVALQLVDSTPTTTGVIIATYRRHALARSGSRGSIPVAAVTSGRPGDIGAS
jgi:hypothetical protein